MPHIKNAFIRFRIIDRMLRNKYKPYPSKKDLREACEESLYGSDYGNHICDSTIEKDMFNMKLEHDAPIKYSKLHRGYYYEDPDFSINDIPLTEDELGSIKFAINTLNQFREVPFFKQFGSAIDKIVDRVSVDQDDENFESFIQFEESFSTGGSPYLQVLLEAIRLKRKVWFQYAGYAKSVQKPRKVSPLFLKEYRNRWYLISFDQLKDHVTTYALDRMQDLQITEDKSIEMNDFNFKEYFKYSTGITAYKGDPMIVQILANATASKYIQSQPFHKSQVSLESNENQTLFELKVLLSEEFVRSLLSFGGEIKIVSPKVLSDIIRERSFETWNQYKNDTNDN